VTLDTRDDKYLNRGERERRRAAGNAPVLPAHESYPRLFTDGREHIVAAAIRGSDGRVVTLPPPNRHRDIKASVANDGSFALQLEGFLTNTGKFVNRHMARLIAGDAGQLKPSEPAHSELTTDNLW